MPSRFSTGTRKPAATAPPPSHSCCPICTPFQPHQRLDMKMFQRDMCNQCTAVADPQLNAQFGTLCVMSKNGNILTVSAPLYDVVANDGNPIKNNGAVFIYERAPFHGVVPQGNPKWILRQRITQPDNLLQDFPMVNPNAFNFGQSIAVSQDGFYIVVGAPLQDNGAIRTAGAAFLYARDPKSCAHWVFVQVLFAQRFDTITLPKCDDGNSNCNGNCSCSSNSNNTCTCDECPNEKTVQVSDSESESGFGYSVAISRDGGVIVVGAPFTNGTVSQIDQDTGAVYIFTRDCTIGANNVTATFQRRCCADGPPFHFHQKLCGPEFPSMCAGTMFGFNVATSEFGETIAVAKPSLHSSNMSCPAEGSVCIFESDHCHRYRLVQEIQPTFAPSVTFPDGFFGTGLRMTPDRRFLFVEAPGEHKLVAFKSASIVAEVGSIYVFERRIDKCGGSSPCYVEVARICPDFSHTDIVSVINAENEISSFDVSDDGCVVVVGYETLRDGPSFNGPLEGGVVVFRFECGAWVQSEILRPFTDKLLPDPNREHAAFGASVTISGNAETFVAGEATGLEQSPPTSQLSATFAYSFISQCGAMKRTPTATLPSKTVFVGRGRMGFSSSGSSSSGSSGSSGSGGCKSCRK